MEPLRWFLSLYKTPEISQRFKTTQAPKLGAFAMSENRIDGVRLAGYVTGM